MELIGINFDSSGLCKMYRDRGVLLTLNGSDEEYLEEIARQPSFRTKVFRPSLKMFGPSIELTVIPATSTPETAITLESMATSTDL